MACTPCFTKRIDNCAESVTIDGQLLPNTVYTWVITDRFGHEWSYNITTDADGSFEIDLTDPMFPAGLFNQFAALTLQVFLYADRCEPATMIFCDIEYNCLTFSVGAGNYTYIEPNRPDEVLTCCFEEILYADIADLILNNGITEGMLYRITDATEYDINLIVTGLNESSVSGLAYSEEFPQDEIFYDIANDVITRRTDTIKKLSAPFDWRNVQHTLYQRKYNAENIGYPCTPVSYDYAGGPVAVASPDATTAGMVFNNSNDLLVWLRSVMGGTGYLGVKEDGVAYMLTVYSIGAFDLLFDNFTVNDGGDKVIPYTDDSIDFYTFGNNITGSGGADTDIVTPAADGNGGTCYNVYINDTQTITPVVIGDACYDIKFGFGIVCNGSNNININQETGGTILYGISSASNIQSLTGGIHSNSDYGGLSANIINNSGTNGIDLTGFTGIIYPNPLLTVRYATERSDSILGLYDYRSGINYALPSTFICDFTQSVDRILFDAVALSAGLNSKEIIIKPTATNTITLNNTAIGALANAGEIICEDGNITLVGNNYDYAILRSVDISSVTYWQVVEYHNFV